MSVVYKLLASQLPEIKVPTDIIDPVDGITTSAKTISPGQSPWTPTFNQNAVRLDLTGRYGGGIYGAAFGLDLTIGTGLSVITTPGQAMIDGPITIADEISTGVLDNARSFLWLDQDGVIAPYIMPDDGSEMEVPDIAAFLLGSVLAENGAITEVDYSGRMELRGGVGFRRTGDIGTPTDTPPSSIQFWTRTQGGLYWWDGSKYWELNSSGFPPDSVKTVEGTMQIALAPGEFAEFVINHSNLMQFTGDLDFAFEPEIEATVNGRPADGIRITKLLRTRSGDKTDGSRFCLLVEYE